MIDWLSFRVPYLGPPVSERYFVAKHGKVEIEAAYMRPVHHRGSHDAGISVMATGSSMYVSGNPVKYLTGQNVVGINCAKTLVRLAYEAVIRDLDLPPCEHAKRAIREGNVDLTRVDCTFAYSVGSPQDVTAFLEAMAECCSVKFRGRGHYAPSMSCVYFGLTLKDGHKVKGSRRSVFKFYDKAAEMLVNKPTIRGEYLEKIGAIVKGTVRGEATYRKMELQRSGHDLLENWTLSTPYDLHKRWIDRMDISAQIELGTPLLNELPNAYRGTYLVWKSGEKCMDAMSRATFYRHRAALLGYGVDIALPPRNQDDEKRRVVPVLECLTAEPVDEADMEELFWELIELPCAA